MLSSLLLIICLTIPVLLFFFFFQYRTTLKKPPRPPGPRGRPIIGNLHQLDSSSLYFQPWEMSKKYGPIFSLQLGIRPAIVVSSPKLAKEVMKDYDLECCERPKLVGQQKMSYNGLDMAFSPCNNYWKEIRKTCVVHVFSSKHVSMFSSLRHFEVKQMIKKISSHVSSSEFTNLNEVLTSLSSTMICRISLGRSYEEEGIESSMFHGLFQELEAMMGTFFLSDYIPFLGWIDILTGLQARLERNFVELDNFYQQVIDEHMDSNKKTPEEEDIVDVLLQLKKKNHSLSIHLTNDNIKAVLMNILLGATDTTSVTAVWAMTELMKNPSVMKKVQEEIRSLSGKKDFIEEDDVHKFLYLKAVIKETLRLQLPAPLLIPRETNGKCIIDGYEIPAKTLVYVNAWAVHRDPEAWKDPEEFIPERFLDSAIDVAGGQDFVLIPFGGGRRMCPGMRMAFSILDLILANLLYSFDWELPPGIKRDDIDTEVLPGLTQRKKNPLCVLAKFHS